MPDRPGRRDGAWSRCRRRHVRCWSSSRSCPDERRHGCWGRRPGRDEALASGLLRSGGDGMWFRHELARLAVEASLPTHRRAQLNEAVLARLVNADADPRGSLTTPSRPGTPLPSPCTPWPPVAGGGWALGGCAVLRGRARRRRGDRCGTGRAPRGLRRLRVPGLSGRRRARSRRCGPGVGVPGQPVEVGENRWRSRVASASDCGQRRGVRPRSRRRLGIPAAGARAGDGLQQPVAAVHAGQRGRGRGDVGWAGPGAGSAARRRRSDRPCAQQRRHGPGDARRGRQSGAPAVVPACGGCRPRRPRRCAALNLAYDHMERRSYDEGGRVHRRGPSVRRRAGAAQVRRSTCWRCAPGSASSRTTGTAPPRTPGPCCAAASSPASREIKRS